VTFPQKNECARIIRCGGRGRNPKGTGTFYGWMVKGATGAPSGGEFSRLQKQNRELLELVGEITLKLSRTPKNS